MTQFEQALAAAKAGQLQTPSVNYEGQQLNFFSYQLAVHRYSLRILATGMKMGSVKLKDIKEYYGLKGKTAKDCMPQFEAIFTAYKAELGI
jgi:hypothetical protein